MLPDAVTQQLGWMPQPPPVDPSLAGPPSFALDPAVLQGMGVPPPSPSAPAMPPPMSPGPVPDSGPRPLPPPAAFHPGTDAGAGPVTSPAPEPGPGAPLGAQFPHGAGGPPSPLSTSPVPVQPTHSATPARPMSIEQQMGKNQADLGAATQEAKAAATAQTQAQLGQAAGDLQAEQDYAAKMKLLQDQAAKQRDDANQAHALAQRTVTDRMKALDNYKIDQNAYWHSMGVGTKISWFVGLALAGIGNAFSGKGNEPNQVLQMLQQKMTQSIVLQQDKRDQLEKGLGRSKDLMQEGDLYQAKRAADIAQSEAEATKMLKVQIDLATAKAADPTIRANGVAESAKLDRQLALDQQTAVEKLATYNIQKQQVGIAGGHLALARKQFDLDVAWKSWEQNKGQQQLDLQAAKEALAERKAIGDKDLQLGVSAPVNDGQGGASTGMLTQKDGTVWHANKPEEATKVQDTVAATTSYNRLIGKMINGIQQHGGESSYLKSDDYQTMVVDLEHATAELHKAYDVPFRGESTIKFLQNLSTGGVDPTSFVYNATKALQESATDLQDRVNDKLRAANYTGKPISFAPLVSVTAESPQDKLLTSLKDNSAAAHGFIGGAAQATLNAAGRPEDAARVAGLSSKLATIATLGQQLENQGPGSQEAAQMLKAVATDTTTVDPRVRAAALKTLEAAAAKRQAASYQAGDKSYPVIHPASPEGRIPEAQSHIPGIINRLNGTHVEPPTLPANQ